MDEPFTRTALLRPDDAHDRRPPRNNSTFIALVRNDELDGIVYSMRQIEQNFNAKFQYPWIFFNNEPFTDEFKRRTALETQAPCFYEQIPAEHWAVPDSVDQDKLAQRMAEMRAQGVKHAADLSYHQMCRWYSGFFYKHPALDNFRYYWRVEPWIQFFCSVEYDVFQYMSDNNKVYGFTINIYDDPLTLPSLWPRTLDFIAATPQHLSHNMAWNWLTDSTWRPELNVQAHGYSTCHFWSNFEIGDLEFWRSPVYESYFQALDQSNGFFYERWGDAPVHSIALGLFEDVSRIHWFAMPMPPCLLGNYMIPLLIDAALLPRFRDIGYRHTVYANCPDSDRCQGCQANKFAPVAFWLNGEDCRVNWLQQVCRDNTSEHGHLCPSMYQYHYHQTHGPGKL